MSAMPWLHRWTFPFLSLGRFKQNKQTQHNKTQQTQQTRQTRQTDKQDKTRRHWAALGLKTPRSARIAQPTPRNPCRGGPGLTAQRQPDHTDPADWSTQNPARKRRTNKTTTNGRTDRRTDGQTNKPQHEHLGAARACNSRGSVARGG